MRLSVLLPLSGVAIASITSLTAFHLFAQEPTAATRPGFTQAQPRPKGASLAAEVAKLGLSLPTQEQKPSTTRGIICAPGQPVSQCDDRQPMIDQRQPWSAIGRITFTNQDQSESYQCTGTLIAESLLLTNAHCIVDPETHQVHRNLQFEPNLINGELQDDKDKAKIVGGTYGTDFKDQSKPPHPQDWAIVRIDKPLGKKYGTIPVQPLPIAIFRKNPKTLIQVGYSFDFPNPKQEAFKGFVAGPGQTAGMHDGCSITAQRKDTVFVHQCDTRGGSSGGPLLGWIGGKLHIVALNSAEFANQQTGIGPENYATDLTPVVDWLAQAKTETKGRSR
jgi:V8-like Glu-specific endopeptidase